MEMAKLPSPSQKAPSPKKEAVLHADGCTARSNPGATQDGVREQHCLQEELYRGLNTCVSHSDIVRLRLLAKSFPKMQRKGEPHPERPWSVFITASFQTGLQFLWERLAPECPVSEDLERSILRKEVTKGFPQLLTHRDTWQDALSGNVRDTDAVQAPPGAFKKCLTQMEINARLDSTSLERKSSVQSQARGSVCAPPWGQEGVSQSPKRLMGRERFIGGDSKSLHRSSKFFPFICLPLSSLLCSGFSHSRSN